MTSEFSENQKHILSQLDYTEWRPLPTAEIADEFDTSKRTVQNHRSELEEKNLVEKKGDGRAVKYRLTGLLRSAEMMGVTEEF